ncbi:MAG: anti-sigma factor [Meiothermus sp.]|nr:anti-sigma factor [Meiothermus sp.]
MKPDELRELLPLYALHALSEAERRQVERDLEQHPELLGELKALQETAAELSGATQVRPRPGLKAEVLGRVQARAAVSAVPRPGGPPQPSKTAPNWPRWLGQAAAVAAVLSVGYCGSWLYPWLSAFTDPKSHFVTLVNEQQQAVGRCIVRQDGRALIWVNLPPPPPGKTYQLWGVRGENHVGLETFRGGLKVFQMPAGYDVVHITEEQSGGSLEPTQIRALPVQN